MAHKLRASRKTMGKECLVGKNIRFDHTCFGGDCAQAGHAEFPKVFNEYRSTILQAVSTWVVRTNGIMTYFVSFVVILRIDLIHFKPLIKCKFPST